METVLEQPRSGRASLEACFRATDLEWRLAQIPDSAECRGAFFNMLDARAGSLSLETQAEYRRFFRLFRFTPFRMYSVRDYLTRIVVLAQIHWGEADTYSGIRNLQSSAFEAWTSTLIGRTAVALAEPSFMGLLRFGERCLSTTAVINYGSARIISATTDQAVMRFYNEYVYIEHAMLGALEGLSKLTSAHATFRVELRDPFNADIHIALPPS